MDQLACSKVVEASACIEVRSIVELARSTNSMVIKVSSRLESEGTKPSLALNYRMSACLESS